jgi:hypothetical protein
MLVIKPQFIITSLIKVLDGGHCWLQSHLKPALGPTKPLIQWVSETISPGISKSRTMRWAGHIARIWEIGRAYKILVVMPGGKRPLGRLRRRWEDFIKMDLREIGLVGVDWINLAQHRVRWRALVNTVINLRVP